MGGGDERAQGCGYGEYISHGYEALLALISFDLCLPILTFQSIAFPPLSNPSHHILTASLSRHLTLHSLSTLSAIDTFFGHQDSIASVSSLKPTLAVTAGSRDRTCRWWKVEEEIQLVFRGGGRSFTGQEPKGEAKKGEPIEGEEADVEGGKKQVEKGKTRGKEFVEGSLDTVCMLDDQRFVSGGDSG